MNPIISKSNEEQLKTICKECYKTVAYYTDLAWGKSRFYLQPMWSTKYDGHQITDKIYISDLATAFNKERLCEEGITHVLNLVLGIDSIYPEEFNYMNIPARDIADQDLGQYFDSCTEFIRNAIEGGGKVLVHCSYGASRSTTVVIAYLIRYHQMTFEEALSFTKSKRAVTRPNDGFVKQLQEYHKQLSQTNQNNTNLSLSKDDSSDIEFSE